MFKKMSIIFFVLLLLGGGLLITQEMSINAFGIGVQDEALPHSLPDYPVEAAPLLSDPTPQPFILEEPVKPF